MSTTTIRLPDAVLTAAGESIPWAKMRTYLEARIAGRKATRSRARKLAD